MGPLEHEGVEVHQERLPFGELLERMRVDEDFWGDNTEARVLDWIKRNYRPGMPEFALFTKRGQTDDSIWLMGWKHDETPYPPLMTLIFGQAHADYQLALNEADMEMHELIDKHGIGRYGMRPDSTKEDKT